MHLSILIHFKTCFLHLRVYLYFIFVRKFPFFSFEAFPLKHFNNYDDGIRWNPFKSSVVTQGRYITALKETEYNCPYCV